jgi:hypothetical protein
MSKFKSDARPSDTKSVVLHKERDARLLTHVNQTKGESGFWRAAGYFYLDFMAWLATQPDAPEPARPFVYYQRWLEQRLTPSPSQGEGWGEGHTPESIAAAILPGVRDVVEAALATALAGLTLPPAGEPGEGLTLELADLFSEDLVLQ